jgi:2-amino-4-hydroxy-6-hydroxymethyldihydropteridine diphosphokinase
MTQPDGGTATRLWYLGLGGNLGDRAQMLRDALGRLDALPGVCVLKRSGMYETAPWGDTSQPAFLNMVALIRSSLKPRALLAETKRIEAELGRRHRRRWGPREIDIDLLLCEGLEVDTPDLKVPHPLMMQRQFVLVPLAELAPDLLMPDGRPVASHVSRDETVQPWPEERSEAPAAGPA